MEKKKKEKKLVTGINSSNKVSQEVLQTTRDIELERKRKLCALYEKVQETIKK